MDVVSLCPLRVGSLVWQPRRGTWVLTAVCKATYALKPTESPLAPEQEYPNEDDNHWNDDPARSLYSPADLIPFKPRADVMLVGHAFAARKEPVRSLVARLIVGEVNKAIEVWCDRGWAPDGSLREGPRFLKMPLRYERAAGGPDTSNPVGVRTDARPDTYGSLPVPNLQPAGLVLASPKDFLEPIGFGPLAWTWPSRRDRLARHAATWSPSTWAQQPIPDDVDPTFFNAAPRDQQTDSLRPNERIVLENLHPEHPRLSTSLPGKTPRAFVERRGAAPQEVQLICDTLWIDTDRGICTLTWRAQIPLEHPAQPGRVLIALTDPGQRLTWADMERLAATFKPEDPEPDTMAPERPSDRAPELAPDRAPAHAQSEPPGGAPYAEAHGPRKANTLPFTQSAAPEPQPRASRPRDRLGETHDEVSFQTSSSKAAGLPFGVATPPPVSAPPPPAPPPRRPAEAAGSLPPWLTQARPPAPPVAAPAPPPTAPPPQPSVSFGAPPPLYAPPPIQPPPAPTFSSPPAVSTLVQPLTGPGGGPLSLGAASQSAPLTSPARAGGGRSREVLDLLWFDPAALPRLRAHLVWKRLLEGEQADGPPEARARRDVSAVLARGEPIEPDETGDALVDAVELDGSFLPPLVLTCGELTFPFDELALLEATLSLVKPFVGGDPRLAEAVAAGSVLLEGEVPGSAAGAAEVLTARLREAFQPQSRGLPASYLDTQTPRMLLAQGRHQHRRLLGASWVRALLGEAGVPVYLPEDLRKHLPMFHRFQARLLAEAHLQQDQYETSPVALKVVALARAVPLSSVAG